ncbi:MAG: ORF6N domain-containing protein [Bacteroidetes bacterium]|nr:ORF6N domain-containing protein [Bacteroidota bacterium]MCW5895491.1 ORF6N domain-containing protein [Bacteroidota bacterium]
MKKSGSKTSSIIPLEQVQRTILLIRGKRVMIDSDLARLYGVSSKRLNEQVKRNRDRFPADFMFQLTADEASPLRSQNATLKTGRGRHRKYLPFAFTEHGALQLASVLNGPTATEVSILIVRAFVQLREILSSHTQIARKLEDLERKIASHDETITSIIQAIRRLMEPIEPAKRRPIGFRPPEEDIS